MRLKNAEIFRSNQEYTRKVEVFDLSHVPRSGNTHADSLATLATSSAQDLPQVVLVEYHCSWNITVPGISIYANFGASGCSSDTSDHAGSKLDGFYITVPGKRCTA